MLESKIQEALEEFKRNAPDPDALRRLTEFYEEMKRAGIAQRQEYSLPAVDTVGVTAYRRRLAS